MDYIFQKQPEEEKINEILKKLKKPNRNISNNIIIEKIDSNLNNIQVVRHKDNYDINKNNIRDNNKKKNKDAKLDIIHIDRSEKDNENINNIQDDNQIQVDIHIPKKILKQISKIFKQIIKRKIMIII